MFLSDFPLSNDRLKGKKNTKKLTEQTCMLFIIPTGSTTQESATRSRTYKPVSVPAKNMSIMDGKLLENRLS